MIHCHLLLTHWLTDSSLWYTNIFYWPTGWIYGVIISSTDPLAISMVHFIFNSSLAISIYVIIFYWPTGCLYGTLLSSTVQLALLMVDYQSSTGPLAISNDTLLFCTGSTWLSLLYTTIFYWPTVYLYGTLSSSTGQLALPMVNCSLLMAHWLSLWYTTIFNWLTGWSLLYTAISYWLTIYLYGKLLFLLAHWLSLYWPSGYFWHTSSTGPLAVSVWYTTIIFWPTDYLSDTIRYITVFYWSSGSVVILI